MSFFPLPFYATLSKEKTVEDRSGQKINSGLDVIKPAINCLFLMTSGAGRKSGYAVTEGAVAFYVAPTVPIEEGHIITDIRTKTGKIVEKGPFKVASAKKTPSLSGSIHHISCKLTGVAGQ